MTLQDQIHKCAWEQYSREILLFLLTHFLSTTITWDRHLIIIINTLNNYDIHSFHLPKTYIQKCQGKCTFETFLSTFYFIILYSSQDPLENSLGTDTDPTIYFVPDTCSRHEHKKRLWPSTIIEETQFSQTKTHPHSPLTSQHHITSHIDSDGDPPLIYVTHHMHTEEETPYDDDFDIDNLPFICHSQPSTTTCEMPEILRNNLYEQSSLESVEVPNTQSEKYNLPTDTTLSSTHNNDSSSIPKDQNSSRQLHEHII